MVRRLIVGVILGAALLGGTAAAQNSPPPPPPPTTTTVAPTTTEQQILPTVVEQTTTTVEPTTTLKVEGVVVARPLPRTGNDFGIQVIVGTGLTAAGLALAIMARIRRQRIHAPAA